MARKRGRGMAASWYGIARTATVDRAGAWVEIDDGGTAKVITGVTEIGEGILTVLAQIAAQEVGIRPEDVTIGDNDTARSPEAAHAGATRQTYMIGNVVALAARDARAKLDAVLAKEWNVDVGTIKAAGGEIWAEGTNHRIEMSEAVHLSKSRGVVPLGSGSFGTDTTGLAADDRFDAGGARIERLDPQPVIGLANQPFVEGSTLERGIDQFAPFGGVGGGEFGGERKGFGHGAKLP